MNSLRLYSHFFVIHLKSAMQHKLSFFLMIIGQFLVSLNVFLGVWFLMSRFHQVNGFSYPQVLLCFAISLMAFTLAETFFRGFDTFSTLIGNGEFDRILVRPRGSIFQVLCSRIELTRIGRLLQAIAMLAYAVPTSGISWTPLKALLVLMMILCGFAVFMGIYLIYAGICFFTLDGLEVFNVLTDGAREYGKYPVGVYGKGVLTFCTYIVPFALFQYYPFLYLIGRDTRPTTICLPLLSCLFLLPCCLLWHIGLRRYCSVGS